jgi:hypothetical protein
MKFGHVTGNKREKHGTPMFLEPAEVRIAKWEAKVAAEKAAKEASK